MFRILNYIAIIMLVLSLNVIAQESSQAPETQTPETQASQQNAESAQEATEAIQVESTGSESTAIDTSEDLDATLNENETVLSATDINPIELSYTVAGESDAFLNDVEDAFMTWQDASVGAIEARQTENALVTFVVADEVLLGPDVITLKINERNLATDIESPRSTTQVLVAEAVRDSSPNLYQSALLHEVGLLVGLPLTGNGVMQRGLTEAIVPSVSVSEARALETQASAAQEDINRDGQIDFYDLVELAKNYTEFPQNFSADITGDGSVNDDDVAQLQSVYTFSDPVDPDSGLEDTTANDPTASTTNNPSSSEGSPTTSTLQENTSQILDSMAERAAQRAQEATQEQDPSQNSDGQ